LVAVVVSSGACYRGPDPDLTQTGKGRPTVVADFPEQAEAGDTVDAVIKVTNPGPGDMVSIVVAFSRLGDPSLPTPIVEVGTGGSSEGVAGVDPEPKVISPDGVIYRFDGLPEGESTSITFELVMPAIRGEVGNAVTVYDGSEPERARGARILISLN
jgi:hypothetical protein